MTQKHWRHMRVYCHIHVLHQHLVLALFTPYHHHSSDHITSPPSTPPTHTYTPLDVLGLFTSSNTSFRIPLSSSELTLASLTPPCKHVFFVTFISITQNNQNRMTHYICSEVPLCRLGRNTLKTQWLKKLIFFLSSGLGTPECNKNNTIC